MNECRMILFPKKSDNLIKFFLNLPQVEICAMCLLEFQTHHCRITSPPIEWRLSKKWKFGPWNCYILPSASVQNRGNSLIGSIDDQLLFDTPNSLDLLYINSDVSDRQITNLRLSEETRRKELTADCAVYHVAVIHKISTCPIGNSC